MDTTSLIWLYLKIWTSSIFVVVELFNILIPSGPLANEWFFFLLKLSLRILEVMITKNQLS